MTAELDVSVSAERRTVWTMQTLGSEGIIPHSATTFVYLSISVIGQPNVWLQTVIPSRLAKRVARSLEKGGQNIRCKDGELIRSYRTRLSISSPQKTEMQRLSRTPHTSAYKVPILSPQPIQQKIVPLIPTMRHMPKLRHPRERRAGKVTQTMEQRPIDDHAREETRQIHGAYPPAGHEGRRGCETVIRSHEDGHGSEGGDEKSQQSRGVHVPFPVDKDHVVA